MKLAIFALAAALAACTQSAPRSTEYFEAHIEEARAIVADCKGGDRSSEECKNASVAVETADGRERFKRFRGKD